MPKQALAKYTRPKQSGLAPRERLFALLDKAREAPLICVCAPAGAGKTSLVASYIEARRPAHLWFQVDATDTDPAGFFANLGALLPKRSHAQLPALLEHNVDNLGAFARLFFRRFFAQLAERCVLVLDCGIELRAHARLAQIVAEAAQEIPAGCNVVLLTRDMPPPQFARLRLQRSLIEVGWDALKLEPDETAAIINASRQQSAFDAQQLHDQCGGWAAGLRLLLEYQPRTGHASGAPSTQGHAALFDYFAAEVFSGLNGATQGALLRTALLPEVTERAARALTQTSSAWVALCELEQRRLFIDLLGTERPALRYHALFREFLLSQLSAKFSPFELRALQRESAALLVTDKRVDAAVPLLTEAGEWSAASRLILEEANTMLARGHTQTLRAWVAALPSWYVDATPRLLYCLGLAQSTSDPAAGIASLERAYQRFLAQRNTLGQALCAAAIIQAHYFRFDDYTGMRPWADALDLLLRQGLACPSPDTELHVCSMLQIALTFVEPDHASLPQIAERVLSLISRGLDVNQTVVAAGMLLTYFDWFAPDKARLLARYIQPLLHARALTPFNHLWWLMAEVHHYGCIFDAQQVRALVVRIEALAEQHALKLSEGALMTLRVKCLDARSASAEADRVLTRGVCALNPARRQEEINLRTYAAELYLQRDDLTAALNDCERALQASRDTGLKISELETLGLRALVLARSDRAEQALESAQAARAVIVRPLPPKLELHHDFIEAYAMLRCDRRDDALSLLRRALASARENGFLEGYQCDAHTMGWLCTEALNSGIETAHVMQMIRAHALMPPPAIPCPAWPWPVRVHVLGRFEVRINGEALSFGGKAPKKPLELLKALVVKGPAAVEQDVLAQELWPDSDGDAAESAVRMALHRLRKLLGSEDSVVVQGGKLQLNPASSWVDAWEFERSCRTIEGGKPATDFDQAVHALALYPGEAFANEALQPWMLPARDRWRSAFLRAVRVAGQAQEGGAQWQDAVGTYESGIRADPLCEEFYQALMQCLLKQGKAAEAYTAYRRCRDALSITLGVKPSAKTEALRQQIAMQGAA